MGAGAHPEYGLGGPGLWVVFALFAITALGAVAVMVDVVRRGDRFGGLAHRLLWATPQGLCLIALALSFAFGGRGGTASAAGLLTLLAFPAQIAYLLRVVYPKHPRTAPPGRPPAEDDPGAGAP